MRYHGGEPEVRLGDRVEVRFWFRKRRGVINYVPGISPVHGEMEHNLLHWIGVSMEHGDFSGILVDPDTGCVLKQVLFLERGAVDVTKHLPPEPFD